MKLYWFSEMPHHEFREGEDREVPVDAARHAEHVLQS